MNLLLDTHVFLWWNFDSPTLSAVARTAIADASNRVLVSSASVWEIAIKQAKGKLRFDGRPQAALEANGFVPLSISTLHAELAGHLDWSHTDPFDRMLVAQARADNLTLVHADAAIRDYRQAAQLWAR